MIPLTNEKEDSYKNQKFVIYVKRNLVLIKKIKKSEIIVIIQENIEELLIIVVIYEIRYQKRFL